MSDDLRTVDREVLIRIQHRPPREEPLQRLLALLPPAVEVIADEGEPSNPLRGYKLCLSGLPEQGHVAVIQDDTIVCRNFAPTLELIAAAHPDTIVALFFSKVPKRTYNLASLRWGKSRYVDVHTSDLIHVVGILWPVARGQAFVQWCDENPKSIRGREIQSDDANVTRWRQLTKQNVRVTVPSIVEHPDDVPSKVNSHRASAGADRGRVAAYWIGDADPLELDWSR